MLVINTFKSYKTYGNKMWNKKQKFFHNRKNLLKSIALKATKFNRIKWNEKKKYLKVISKRGKSNIVTILSHRKFDSYVFFLVCLKQLFQVNCWQLILKLQFSNVWKWKWIIRLFFVHQMKSTTKYLPPQLKTLYSLI